MKAYVGNALHILAFEFTAIEFLHGGGEVGGSFEFDKASGFY